MWKLQVAQGTDPLLFSLNGARGACSLLCHALSFTVALSTNRVGAP